VPFNERGRRLDEGLAMMRAVWTQDPVTFHSRTIPAVIEGMTMTPMPVSPIPLWLGGNSDAAIRRTIRVADGWHGSGHTPATAAPLVQRLRAERPETGFTISMRVHWNGRDQAVLQAAVEGFAAIGVEHVMIAPEDRNIDDWDSVIDGAGRLAAQ
jgi:alkanesulfonate monooxygenase SsuD/methylene tetrahydromethanopterin reductase-like flavin-dependent oxidoreductase (luciferase family)